MVVAYCRREAATSATSKEYSVSLGKLVWLVLASFSFAIEVVTRGIVTTLGVRGSSSVMESVEGLSVVGSAVTDELLPMSDGFSGKAPQPPIRLTKSSGKHNRQVKAAIFILSV